MSPVDARRPAVFLDRDGTIIQDRDYLSDPAGIELLPGVAEGIGRLNRVGLPVVVITNQSGIGRGYFTEAEYRRVEERLERVLASSGAEILATYHCPHSPDRSPPCSCRKPAPGLFLRAAADHSLDLSRSVFIGDRMRDVEAGVRFGGRGYLLVDPEAAGGDPPPPGVELVSSLAEAVEELLGGEVRSIDVS